MANIVLTYKCNLKCPYCFANEFVNNINKEISYENFVKVLNYIKKIPNERIGLIGGEPTLHELFGRFIEIINKDKLLNKIVLYTNGLFLDKYINELKNKKIKILINCNSPEDIGDKQYSILEKNIDLIHRKKKKDQIFFGVNIYENFKNYDYIIDLLKKYNHRNLRISIVVPNKDVYKLSNSLDVFRLYKENLLKFFAALEKIDVLPSYDCNFIPDCIWEENEKLYIQQFMENVNKKRKNKKYKLLNNTEYCMPVIDILPDMTAIRCFGFSEQEKININDFENIDEIRRYFIRNWDNYAKNLISSKQCKDCEKVKFTKCSGGCLTYKIHNIIKVKSYVNLLNDI